MNMIMSMMRLERLKYALKREIDRQAAVFEEGAETMLVDAANKHIEAYTDDDEKRIYHAERAEKTLQPIVGHLTTIADGNTVTSNTCAGFLKAPAVKEFPWTLTAPRD